MLIAGLDLAAEPKGTAIATLEWSEGQAQLIDLQVGVADDSIIGLALSVEKLGIDCALGWPIEFVDFINAYSAGAIPSEGFDGGIDWRRKLAYRETDREVRRVTGRWPLSVSTDRLGMTAMRCAGILSKLQSAGVEIDKSGRGKVVEIYPAASMRIWGLQIAGYRNSESFREQLVGELQAVALGGYSFETNYQQYLSDLKKLPRPYYLNSNMTDYETAPMYWSPSDVQQYLTTSSTDLPGCRSTNRYALSYGPGAYTVMALSAIGGWESTMSLLPMLSDGMSLNSAFKLVYGITWDAALPTISQVVSDLIMQTLDPPSAGVYQASEPKNVVSLTGVQGCAAYDASNSQTVRARVQVFQNNNWLDVPTIEQTWASAPNLCRGLPARLTWLVTLKVALDHGAAYRFLYLGDVNIGLRDEYGRGYSQTYIQP